MLILKKIDNTNLSAEEVIRDLIHLRKEFKGLDHCKFYVQIKYKIILEYGCFI